MTAARRLAPLALLILLPCCAATGRLADPIGSGSDEPLTRFVVGVEAADGRRGGGVIVHSSAEHGTYVLTAHHVVDAEDGAVAP